MKSTEDKKKSSLQFEGIFSPNSIEDWIVFTTIWYRIQPEFGIYCTNSHFFI